MGNRAMNKDNNIIIDPDSSEMGCLLSKAAFFVSESETSSLIFGFSCRTNRGQAL